MHVEPLAQCLAYSQLSQMLGAIIILEVLLLYISSSALLLPVGETCRAKGPSMANSEVVPEWGMV